MKIGILIEDNFISKVNFNRVEICNPGIGGTEYLLLQLAYFLQKRQHNDIEVLLFLKEYINIDSDCKQIRFVGYADLYDKLDSYNIQKLIFKPNGRTQDFYYYINKWNGYAIAWVHNYIGYIDLKNLTENVAVKKVVFVGKEHYESYCDDEVFRKSTYIFNMVTQADIKYIPPEEKDYVVTYVGALIKTKGFHKLAKVWKDILKKIPEAQLNIVGSGRLYDRNAILGKYGIAEAKYEKKIMRYLKDENGNLLKSVHFLGTMGEEKNKVIENTKVGVANPTGKSETFCLSAVEFESGAIPVVAYKGYGFLDTVIDGKTGILVKSSFHLKRAIIKLLTDNNLNSEYGLKARELYIKKFTPDIIVAEWEKLLLEKENNTKELSYDNLFNDFKWIKIINKKIKNIVSGNWMSLSAYISKLKYMVKSLLRRIYR